MTYSPQTFFPKSSWTYFLLLLCAFLYPACEGGDIPASTALDPVINILVLDNGNNGNASDIELNFMQQRSTSDVKEYRAIAVKKDQVASFDLAKANGISPDNYTKIAVDEVYPVKGKALSAQSRDAEGAVIVEGEKYIFAILSVSKDEKRISNSLAMSDEEFEVKLNNQITDFTQKLDAGSGSLTMDASGEIYMANYDIVAHVGNNQENAFPIFKIFSSGAYEVYTDSFSLQFGNAFDSQSNLYHAHLLKGEVSITSPNARSTQFIPVQGFMPPKPDGIYVDAQDNVFVADQGNGTIVKINPDSTTSEFAYVGKNPRGITGDSDGNLYISHNHIDGQISKITPAGDVSVFAYVPAVKPEDYLLPYQMWVGYLVYHEEALYVAGMSTDRIYKINMSGDVSVFAGSGVRGIPRGGALSANLNRPIGLVFSQDGKSLYISGSTDVTPQHTQSTTPARIWEMHLLE